MRPADFSIAMQVYNENEDARVRLQADLARGVAWKVIVPWLKQKPKSLHSFWPLPWDEEARDGKMTPEERAASISSFLKKLNRDGKEEPES